MDRRETEQDVGVVHGREVKKEQGMLCFLMPFRLFLRQLKFKPVKSKHCTEWPTLTWSLVFTQPLALLSFAVCLPFQFSIFNRIL